MDLHLSEDQEALQSTLRSLFAKHSTPQRVREVEAGTEGWDRDLWRVIADAGMLGLTIDEDRGGSGSGAIEAVILAEEAGRALALVPLVEADAIAGRLLAGVEGGSEASEWLQSLIGGARVVIPVASDAVEIADGCAKGEAPVVAYGAAADAFLVITGDRIALVPLAGAVEVGCQPALGPAPVARVCFDGVQACVLDVADGVIDSARDAGMLAAAASAVGGMDSVLSYTVEYAKQRRQFDRPIGSFQVLQHRMADMALDLERARLLVMLAASKSAHPEGDPGALLAAAAFCFDAYLRCAKSACQVLGGYGFMLEYDAQLHLRRAKSLQLAWPSRPTLERLAHLVLSEPELVTV